jgi:hypothetical protein
MPASVQIFSIPLGIFSSRFSPEELEARKKAAREEVAILVPASKQLFNSVLRESYLIKDGQLHLSFDLAEAQQLALDFTQDNSGPRKSTSALAGLGQDLMRLKESSEFTQIRIGNLIARLTTQNINAQNNEGSNCVVDNFDKDELRLRQFAYAHNNKSKRVCFLDRDINFQIPLLPLFELAPTERTIRAGVKSMSHASVTLISIKDVHCNGVPEPSYILPSTLDIRRSVKKDDVHWMLLYAAMEHHLPIEAEVKLALHAHNLQPAYLELVKINNANHLREQFALMNDALWAGEGK